MDHEDIAKKAAEAIMQRANDTYPRTLHKDMLVDEISKAIREATKWQNWPPTIAVGDLPSFLQPPAEADGWQRGSIVRFKSNSPVERIEAVTTSHDRMRAKLAGKPE